MPPVTLHEITATSATLDAAAALFDRYRVFYGQPSNPELARRYLCERLQAGESTVLLARLHGEWVGFCQLYRGFSSISCTQTVVLNDLYVEEHVRGKGVGRALVAHVIEHARRQRAASVVLETAVTNLRAQSLYAQLGFERADGFTAYSMNLCAV